MEAADDGEGSRSVCRGPCRGRCCLPRKQGPTCMLFRVSGPQKTGLESTLFELVGGEASGPTNVDLPSQMTCQKLLVFQVPLAVREAHQGMSECADGWGTSTRPLKTVCIGPLEAAWPSSESDAEDGTDLTE
eukprot:4421850-Amphidinium_carterae.2